MPKTEDAAAKRAREEQVIKIYKMMEPRPKELLLTPRRYILGGAIHVYNVKEKRLKPRVIFLFNDTLLIGKREGRCKYWLKTLIRLTPTMRLEDMRVARGPQVEFRLVTPKRVIVFFAQSEALKQLWLKHIANALQGKYDLDYEPPTSAAGGSASTSAAASPAAAASQSATSEAKSDDATAAGDASSARSADETAASGASVNSDSGVAAAAGAAAGAEAASNAADGGEGSERDVITVTETVTLTEQVFSFGDAVIDDGGDGDLDLDLKSILADLSSLSLDISGLER